ncbi:MAG: DUF3530 family protein, partial [Gammaproteobacteria bacterium]|nr:DUF3530 family protein [Gammaproteobacteria bacterium]
MRRDSPLSLWWQPIRALSALILLLSLLTPDPVNAAPLSRQQRWMEDIKEILPREELVTLKTGDVEFIGLHRAKERGQETGSLIMIHDYGAYPDGPSAFHYLRTRLPSLGWSTLSFELPVLPETVLNGVTTELMEEVVPRINAARDYILAQNVKNIVLLGHGVGATIATYYFVHHFDRDFRGLIMMGMDGTQPDDSFFDA